MGEWEVVLVMSGDHCAEKCGGLSLVFLHDPR